MAHQLPAGAPRVPPAKDSLARSYECLNRQPRQPQVIHNPFEAERPAATRLAIAAWGGVALFSGYVAIQVARAVW